MVSSWSIVYSSCASTSTSDRPAGPCAAPDAMRTSSTCRVRRTVEAPMISRRAFFGVAAGVSAAGVGARSRQRSLHVQSAIARQDSGAENRQGGDCLQVAGTAAERIAGDEGRPVDHRPERRQQGVPRRLRRRPRAAIVRDRHGASERHHVRRRGAVDRFDVQLRERALQRDDRRRASSGARLRLDHVRDGGRSAAAAQPARGRPARAGAAGAGRCRRRRSRG